MEPILVGLGFFATVAVVDSLIDFVAEIVEIVAEMFVDEWQVGVILDQRSGFDCRSRGSCVDIDFVGCSVTDFGADCNPV